MLCLKCNPKIVVESKSASRQLSWSLAKTFGSVSNSAVYIVVDRTIKISGFRARREFGFVGLTQKFGWSKIRFCFFVRLSISNVEWNEKLNFSMFLGSKFGFFDPTSLNLHSYKKFLRIIQYFFSFSPTTCSSSWGLKKPTFGRIPSNPESSLDPFWSPWFRYATIHSSVLWHIALWRPFWRYYRSKSILMLWWPFWRRKLQTHSPNVQVNIWLCYFDFTNFFYYMF